jgi:hypothetical protein
MVPSTEESTAQSELPDTTSIVPVSQDPLAAHFLGRLTELESLRQAYESSAQLDLVLLQAVKKSIYSTLRDCKEVGVGEEADKLLLDLAKGKI